MNFFEAELKKIMAESTVLKDQKYVGRLCYGTISDELRAMFLQWLQPHHQFLQHILWCRT